MRLSGFALPFLAAAMPAAGEISLALPIDCTLGEDCYIQQVVDQDPTGGISDFQCGTLSYNGHKGTDFALPSLDALEAGVAVLAAAAGEVRATRNDMVDALQGVAGAPDVADVECGNGVVLRHPDGWETQYCHMAQGSIAVSVGERVEPGDTLGFVGLSGATEFPHLHLSVRQRGTQVDPFDPDMTALCDAPSPALWDTAIAVPAGGIITAGFYNGIPSFEAIKAGDAGLSQLATNDEALVLWGFGFGTQAGDVMEMAVTGPSGVVFETRQDLDRTQAQMFRAGGRRTPASGWPAGNYTGEVILWRGEIQIDRETTTVTLTRD